MTETRSTRSISRHLFAVVGASVFASVIASTAAGQSNATFRLTSSNIVTPQQPTTTIEIWAQWGDIAAAFVFGGADYALTASEGAFGNATNILNGPGSSVGVVQGSTITGASNGQIHLPPLGIFGSPDNPILLASYEWTTTDFQIRYVTLQTSNTNNFLVAAAVTGATTQLFPQSFTPGSGLLVVIPSASTVSLLALGGVVVARRRRAG